MPNPVSDKSRDKLGNTKTKRVQVSWSSEEEGRREGSMFKVNGLIGWKEDWETGLTGEAKPFLLQHCLVMSPINELT